MRKTFTLLSLLFAGFLFGFLDHAQAYPEYSAYSASNCMACHVGPNGGFGRRTFSTTDTGFVSDKFCLTGDFQFMALYDKRPTKDKTAFFPMEGALHFAFRPLPNLTIVASQDFATLREFYAMIQDKRQQLYLRAGVFTLPYGLFFADHTAFIVQGRVESTTNDKDMIERGIGSGIYGVRYKDTGMEMGYNGKPWFAGMSVTNGVVGQESRFAPSGQSGSGKAIISRAGFIIPGVSLGVSNYTNKQDDLGATLKRTGVFGWFKLGQLALLFEHDEGKGVLQKTNSVFSVASATRPISASYAELVYYSSITNKKWPSYSKVRYERLDPDKDTPEDILQRWIFSYRFYPYDYLSFETFYRVNKEQPTEYNNNDVFLIAHVFF